MSVSDTQAMAQWGEDVEGDKVNPESDGPGVHAAPYSTLPIGAAHSLDDGDWPFLSRKYLRTKLPSIPGSRASQDRHATSRSGPASTLTSSWSELQFGHANE